MAKMIKSKMKESTSQIIAALQTGLRPVDVANKLNLPKSQVYSINQRYNEVIEKNKTLIRQVNVDDYEDVLIENIKKSIMLLSNTISTTCYQKSSLSQQTTSLGILIDKLRLLEGKSNNNIDIHILIDQSPELKATLNRFAIEFKKGLLSNESD